MGKTFEALQRAEKSCVAEGLPSKGSRVEAAAPLTEGDPRPADLKYYEDLRMSIFTRCRAQSVKSVLFVGTTPGGGTSTTAVNFALSLAGDHRLRVLLVDADLRTSTLHRIFGIRPSPGLSDLITDGGRTGLPLRKVAPGNLYLLPCGSGKPSPARLFEGRPFSLALKAVRDKFDYVILDGPRVPGFAESKAICTKVDGVVLVLAAGKTRRQVACRAKREFEDAGVRLLGVVLNRKKYHIPQWLYRRL